MDVKKLLEFVVRALVAAVVLSVLDALLPVLGVASIFQNRSAIGLAAATGCVVAGTYILDALTHRKQKKPPPL